jgi:hypothetical protein
MVGAERGLACASMRSSENRTNRLWLHLHATITINFQHTTINALLEAVAMYFTTRYATHRSLPRPD